MEFTSIKLDVKDGSTLVSLRKGDDVLGNITVF
jgi:hypothetical protein